MWPVSLHTLLRAGAVLFVFAAGFFLAWTIRGNSLTRAEADMASLKLEYAADLENARKVADQIKAQEQAKAKEVVDGLRKQIERIRANAGARGGMVKRVQCSGKARGPGTGGASAGPGGAAPGTPSGLPVGPMGSDSHIDLDLSGIYALGDEGKVVSARLRSLIEVCQ